MNKKLMRIDDRIKNIKQELLSLEEMRPGSISAQRRLRGGTYLQLTYACKGKPMSEYVRPENKEKVVRQLAAYRKFKELTREWVGLSIERSKLVMGK
jgi:predicted nuclease with TOPRIM domain